MNWKHEIREAIESARTVGRDSPAFHHASRSSFDHIRALILAVVRELPEEMLVSELRDELEIVENQTPGRRAGSNS